MNKGKQIDGIKATTSMQNIEKNIFNKQNYDVDIDGDDIKGKIGVAKKNL